MFWTESRTIIGVTIIGKSAQRILSKVEAPAPLATNGILIKVAVGWRLPNEKIGRGLRQASVSELSTSVHRAVYEVTEYDQG